MLPFNKNIAIIVAAGNNNEIGNNNQLLWHLPEDLKFFKKLTTGNTVIMGRKTFESIGKALPNRQNIVVTRNPSYDAENIIVAHSLQEAIQKADREKIFIIGGAEIYQQALPLVDTIFLTQVNAQMQADAFFPKLDNQIWKVDAQEKHFADSKHPFDYTFITLKRL